MAAINHETIRLQHQAWKDGAEKREKERIARQADNERIRRNALKESMDDHLGRILLILQRVAADDSTDPVHFTSAVGCSADDVHAIKLKLEALGFTVIHPIPAHELLDRRRRCDLSPLRTVFQQCAYIEQAYNAPFNLTVKNTWATSPDYMKTE
jgi:hypothetical protein